MKPLNNKPVSIGVVSSKNYHVAPNVSLGEIKLKTVTSEDRERLRIPSYKYILP